LNNGQHRRLQLGAIIEEAEKGGAGQVLPLSARTARLLKPFAARECSLYWGLHNKQAERIGRHIIAAIKGATAAPPLPLCAVTGPPVSASSIRRRKLIFRLF